MLFSKSAVGLLVAACSAIAAPPSKPVKKDVIVIGGGASGAHAAVRLRDDYGLSVALIEKQDILVC
jgi:glycerol-3-phosphate dehydrogenase